MKKNNLVSNVSRNSELDLNLIQTSVEVSTKNSTCTKIKKFFFSGLIAEDLTLEKWAELESKPYRNQSVCYMPRSHIDYRNLINRK